MSWEDILKENRWAKILRHLTETLEEYKRDYPQANTISFNPYSEIWMDLKWALSQPNGKNQLSDLGRSIGLNAFNEAHRGDREQMAFYY